MGFAGVVSAEAARSFAEEWVAGWNAHDLDRILSHYAPDVVFLSPTAHRRLGEGRVVGVEALRANWAAGLASQPNLRFELLEVLAGYRALTILYRNHRGETAGETFEFGEGPKVVRSFACYGPPPSRQVAS
jgi:hypothetical protein